MTVSIIIPHKNSAEKLNRLVNTIPEDFSIIIIDDCSDSIERENIECLSKNMNITIIDNQGPEYNAGVSRNIGLKACDSDWVIFSDADDYFITKSLIRLKKQLKMSSSDVIFFGCEAIKESGIDSSRRCDRYKNLLEKWPDNTRTIAYEWVVPWGKALRKSVIDKASLSFASRVAGNDVEFSTDLASLNLKKEVFNYVVYICTESPDSLTATKTREKSLSRLNVGIARNRKLYLNKVLIHYDYNVRYFIRALPVIVKFKKFDVIFDFLGNFLLSFYMNLIYPIKIRVLK